MQHKPLIVIVLAVGVFAASYFAVTESLRTHGESSSADMPPRTRIAASGVGGVRQPTVDAPAQGADLEARSRWPTREPATTVSKMPTDFDGRGGTATAPQCSRFHGTWRAASGEEIRIEPDGAATWTEPGARAQPIVWECSRAGDVYVRLPSRTIEFTYGDEVSIVEQGSGNSPRSWRRAKIVIDEAASN